MTYNKCDIFVIKYYNWLDVSMLDYNAEFFENIFRLEFCPLFIALSLELLNCGVKLTIKVLNVIQAKYDYGFFGPFWSFLCSV